MANQTTEAGHAMLRDGGKGVARGLLFSLLFSLTVGAVALLVTALVFHFAPISTSYIRRVGGTLGAITALLGGFIIGRRQRHTGALFGLLFGFFYTLILLLVGRSFGGESAPIKRMVGYGIFLLLSVIGGGLGTIEHKGRHHRRRRR